MEFLNVIVSSFTKLKFKRSIAGFLFILPATILLIWWGIIPLFYAIYISLHDWHLLRSTKRFAGLRNYATLLSDSRFWNSLKNTTYYSLQIPIGMVIALALAVLLIRMRSGNLFRTIFYIPAVTSMVVISVMWKWLYNPEFGVLNYLLSFVGLGPYKWLDSRQMVIPSLIVMMVWYSLGHRIIMFSSGLQSIPKEYYEAAVVDGASGFQQLIYITLPLLKPITLFILVTSVISPFQIFAPVWMMTRGGPLRASEVIVYLIYQEAWQRMNMGYAAAQSWILFGLLFVFTVIQFRLMGKDGIRY